MRPEQFAIEPTEGGAVLEQRWRALEARVPSRFFLGWRWTAAWLAATDARPLLLRAEIGGSDAGLALLCRASGVLGSRIVALNEAGTTVGDIGYVEYNGLLGLRDDPQAIDAAARFLVQARDSGPIAGWDELRLSGVPRHWATSFAAAGAWVSVRSAQRSFAVDLAALRAQGGDALAAMKPNTRQQIRRARRLYAERGEVAIAPVEGARSCAAAIAELATLHQARWQAKGAAGSFASPVFRRLVQELCDRGAAAGDVEILRATAGDSTIGILLNLRAHGEVANYIGAFRLEDDNRLKPGLLTHALAIEHHLAAGSRVYDLLAGEARYKASLAAPREEMLWLSVRPRTLRAHGLAMLGRVLARFERWRGAAAGSTS